MMNQMPQRMDADLQSDQHLNEHHQTQLTKQLSVHHLCDHRCSVQHLFGNAYSCESSGQVSQQPLDPIVNLLSTNCPTLKQSQSHTMP